MSGAMSRLAVLAIASVLLPSALHAQTNKADSLRRDAMHKNGWDNPVSALWDEEMGRIDEFTELVNDARWKTDETCQQHKTDMQTFLVGAVMYWAEDRVDSRSGQTLSVTAGITEFFVVFNRDLYDKWDEDQMLATLLHEGWHWAHKETVEGTKAGKAESCAWLPLEEEDDDDPNGTGETPTTENCDETLEWVEPVTDEVFVKPPSTQLEGSSLTGLPGVDPVPISGITVSAESKGEWVTVVVEEGYWKTVTVCES